VTFLSPGWSVGMSYAVQGHGASGGPSGRKPVFGAANVGILALGRSGDLCGPMPALLMKGGVGITGRPFAGLDAPPAAGSPQVFAIAAIRRGMKPSISPMPDWLRFIEADQ